MIGYKAFNNDLSCRDFQYEVGKTYEMYDKPKCCFKGFHFCKDLKDCFLYYKFGLRICEVESLGDLDSGDEKKFCTNKIKIIRELSFEEVCDTIGIETIIGKNLIKSFKLTEKFFRDKCALVGGSWNDGVSAGPFYWDVYDGSGYWYRNIGARLSKDFKKIEFFRWDNLNKVLFECDSKKIHQVEELEDEDLEWFEYLKNNLEF